MSGWGAAAAAMMQTGTSAAQLGFSHWQARKQFDRQKKLYRNRFQWAVEDARKAGLNPLLVAGGGAGSAGQAGMAASPNIGSPAAAMAAGAEAERSTKKASPEARLLQEQGDKTGVEKDLAKVEADWRPYMLSAEQGLRYELANRATADRDHLKAQEQESLTRAEKERAEIGLIAVQVAKQRADLPSAQERAAFDRTNVGRWLIRIGRGFSHIAEPVTTAVGVGVGAAAAKSWRKTKHGRKTTVQTGPGEKSYRRVENSENWQE